MLLLGLLLLDLLLNLPLLLLFFCLLADFLHLDHPHLVKFSVAVRILTLLVHTSVIVIGSSVVIAARHSRERADADVLTQELLGGEVVHEVLGSDVSLVLALLLSHDLLELLANCLGYLFKQECQCFSIQIVVERLNVLSKLLVYLLDHPRAPSFNLVVYQVDFLLQLDCFLLSLSECGDFFVEGLNFWRQEGPLVLSTISCGSGCSIVFIIFHLVLMQLGGLLLVLNPKVINFALILRDGHQELRVGVLTSQEPRDDLIHVTVPSGCPDLLEGQFDILVPVHLLLHLLLHELTPESLDHERLLEVYFLLVFVVRGGQLGDLLLPSDSLLLVVKGQFLVFDRGVQAQHSDVSFSVVQTDLVEDLFELCLGLDALLLDSAKFVGLLSVNILLRLERLLKLS